MTKAIHEKHKEEKMKEINQEIIEKDLSFMTDLSLTNVNESFSLYKKSNSRKELISEEDKNNEFSQSKVSDIDQNEIILTEDKLLDHDKDEFEEKVNFERPKSILNSIMKFKDDIEFQKKLKTLRNRFNLNNYLKKQETKGTNMKNVGKRKSFLKFLQYTEEPDNLDDYIIKSNRNNFITNDNNISKEINTNLIDSEKNNIIDLININEEFKNNSENKGDLEDLSILSKDSHLSIDQNVSINDINLIPQEIK